MLLKDTTPPLSRVKHFTTALTEHLLTRYIMHILFEHLMLPQEWKFCLIEKNTGQTDRQADSQPASQPDQCID